MSYLFNYLIVNQQPVKEDWRHPQGLLPQMEEFKIFWVLFMSWGGIERELDGWIGAASAVSQPLHRSVVVKSCGHQLWALVTSWLRNKVRSSVTWERHERQKEPVAADLVMMPPGRFPAEVFFLNV